MQIALCFVTMMIGVVLGYIAGRVAEEIHFENEPPLTAHQDNDIKLLRQYQNFLNYNGTGKGQIEIENKN